MPAIIPYGSTTIRDAGATGISVIQAVTQAQAQAAIGMQSANADVVYVRSNGVDATGVVGDLNLPFLTGTAAFAAAVANDVRSIDFGVGEFEIALTVAQMAAAHSLFVRGAGPQHTILTVSCVAEAAIADENGESVVIDLTIKSDQSCSLVFAIEGGDGTLGVDGGDISGTLTLNNCIASATAANVFGGAAGSGDAGAITAVLAGFFNILTDEVFDFEGDGNVVNGAFIPATV